MAIINIKELIEPISDEHPTGVDLRSDTSATSLYYQIKDARQAARSAERRGMDGEEGRLASEDWQTVFRLGKHILKNHSKDLEITAWFVESLLRKHKIAGLHKGFILTKKLITKYWDNLYPIPDEDDGLETKVASFAGLNGIESPGSLILPIAHTLLTEPGSVGPFALWQYKQALDVSKISNLQDREQRFLEIGFSLNDIKQAVSESKPDFYKQIIEDVDNALGSFKELEAVFTEKCGDESPPTSMIKDALIEVKDHIKFILQDLPFKSQVTITSTQNNPITKGSQDSVYENALQVEITNRNDALQLLRSVDIYFSEREPHSPIPFLLKRAVKWGGLALPDLLKELIVEEKTRGDVFKLMGVEL